MKWWKVWRRYLEKVKNEYRKIVGIVKKTWKEIGEIREKYEKMRKISKKCVKSRKKWEKSWKV